MVETRPPSALRERIASHIVEQIERGVWAPGARVPAESALVAQFQASRMTVHNALRELTTRGLLRRHKGLGTFVAEPRPYVSQYAHLDIIEEIESRHARHSARVIRQELRPANAMEAADFAVAAGQALFHAIVLHLENGTPLELEDRLINPSILPNAIAVDLEKRSLFSLLLVSRPFRQGDETVRAILATPEEQRLLALGEGEPCLEVVRRTWSPDGVVTRARLLRPGSRAIMRGRIAPAGFEPETLP